MGDEYDARVFKYADKGIVAGLWNDEVQQSLAEDGGSYSGAIGMLKSIGQWHDLKLATVGDAHEYIEEHHKKWEPAMAVSCYMNGQLVWVVGGICAS